jgi:hypothetical protein
MRTTRIAHRAGKLDEVARDLVARRPDALGLDLGAGPAAHSTAWSRRGTTVLHDRC